MAWDFARVLWGSTNFRPEMSRTDSILNLYLVERLDDPPGHMFNWKAFLLAAPDANWAKSTHPDGELGRGWTENGSVEMDCPIDWIPFSQRDQLLKVTCFGRSRECRDNPIVFSQSQPWQALENVVVE